MAQSIISQFRRAYNLPIELYRVVANVSGRDSINTTVRYEGMIVYSEADGQTYILRGGITNGDWEVFGHVNGVNGTFTTTDAKTVTVENGLIISIV